MFLDGTWGQLPTWLSGEGPAADIVLCTRVRLARNLASLPFPHLLDEEQLNGIRVDATERILRLPGFAEGWGLDLAVMDPIQRQALLEAHLVSRDLLRDPEGRALVVSADRRHAVMINEEDHFRLQSYRDGFAPLETCRDALDCDSQFEEELDPAFSEDLGYLTACPTNVGTGLRLSVLIHLPGLVYGGEIEKILNSLRQLQFAVRGFEGEGSAVRGALFQISNLASLGRTEEEMASDFTRHVSKVIHYERMALERLHERDPVAVEDLAHRGLAMVQHARVMTGQEALDRLSQVRMGVVLDILPRIAMEQLNRALIHVQSAHLQLRAERTVEPAERGRMRADLLRNLFRHI